MKLDRNIIHKALQEAVSTGHSMVMMNNPQPIEVYNHVEVKLPNDKVVARSTERGRQSIDYRNNATPRYSY